MSRENVGGKRRGKLSGEIVGGKLLPYSPENGGGKSRGKIWAENMGGKYGGKLWAEIWLA